MKPRAVWGRLLSELQITEATAVLENKHRILVPYPEPKPARDCPYKLAYAKPSQCNVVGSYVSKTMVKSQPSHAVDMVIQMPQALFQDKDLTNMRYFYRRAYYIAFIAAHVRSEYPPDAVDFAFECLNENPLLPVLVLRPHARGDTPDGDGAQDAKKPSNKGRKPTEYSIRLIPCAPDGLFPWAKLTPASACTRAAHGGEQKANAPATPFYNSTLNAERTFIQYLRVLEDCKTKCPAFSDACVLGRIWLQQRGFGGAVSRGGFGNFEWSAMIALLLQMGGPHGQALSTSLSSTELFKAAIQFLSTTDFVKKPFAFGASKVDLKAVREPGPVMFDPARELNLLFKMTPSSAGLLQLHAKSTAGLLADEAVDKLDATFIVKADVAPLLFDASFKITSPDVSSKFSNAADRSSAPFKFSLEAHRTLKRAYGERAQLVHIQQQPRPSWPLGRASPGESSEVLVSVIFEPAHMSRQMEYGPPAEEQKEAAAFRQFWGDKAELRRFKDGSILECVEWASRLPVQICHEIAEYALKRHLKIIKGEFAACEGGIAAVLGLSHLDKEAFDAARRAFSTLEHDIRNLEDLPLQVRQLSPVSPMARYSSVRPPTLGFHTGLVEPMDVNMYFEASSRWPENMTAIQEAKMEFLLDIDRRLTASHENITTHLGRENREIGIENLSYLDVVYDTGAAFRLRIYCDLEETLLERQASNKTLDNRVREEAAGALNRSRWLYETLPLHTQTIATFCTRLQCLSQSIRLVKHWFDSHKLTGHIGEELIELLVLHVFLQPYPWAVPTSSTAGFLRTLFFLSRWDWRDEPLVVDSAGTLTSESRLSIRRELESWRRRDPHMNTLTLCVATSSDQSGLAYSRHGPSKLVASRMTRLAKAACRLVRDKPLGFDAAALFETSLHDYDVLLHLAPKAVRAALRDATAAAEAGAARRSRFKNLDGRTGETPLPVRAHPVDVLAAELQRVYEDTLVFFRGARDDAVLAAIWNPKLQQAQRFRAGLPYNFCRARARDGDGADAVEVNQEAVLLEIARAGGHLFKRIEVVDE